VTDDLSTEALAAAMPGREVRTYPAVLSTEADARAWARAGGPAGGVVVADYQASARGRGGLQWQCRPGQDLGFTLILRPALAPDEEGWLYVAASLAACEVLGGDAAAEWPDRISCRGRHAADVAGHAGLEQDGVGWAVVNVLVVDAPTPRAALTGRLAAAVERFQQPGAEALARYAERCTTLGREVTAHLIPTWPDGVRIGGVASRVLPDGALVIEEPDGRRVAVRPQHLARLELSPIDA
jgi:BirA family transcriptional regulator, biotin operon repressor / biotin---[acetyl-CoA-carboxylase] ligase